MEKARDEAREEARILRAEAQERDRLYETDLQDLRRRANAASRRDSVAFSAAVVGVRNEAKARANSDIARSSGGFTETLPAVESDNP